MHTLVVHGHFYQPPREDPWSELVEAEAGAAPDHDWNSRIDRECYAPFGATEVRAADPRALARDPDARGGLARIVNLYAWCSFDVGPTLCEWMDRSSSTFRLMREGDAASVKRLGHGNAIAAPYHHIILPLASRRDKITEVRWGVADFRRRFGRDPEGIWLPECAVDEETLEVVAAEGITFTILAPYQVKAHSPLPGGPVRWKAGGGREVIILPYDGTLAGDVAFGSLLSSPAALAKRFTASAREDAESITTLATDGETFGHHHAGGNVSLADALARVKASGSRLSNAAAVVAEARSWPAERLPHVEILAPSSWSCAHGVERWRSDCGCRLDSNGHTSQGWRRPLRDSLEELAGHCHEEFEREGRELFADDPWEVRNRYGGVVASEGDELASMVRSELRNPDDSAQLLHARKLLELERSVLRTFTSCAWFFDDVARIEVRQVLRYAARALALSGKAARLTNELISGLGMARGNSPSGGTGAELFVREAVPHVDPLLRAAAGIAIEAILDDAGSDEATPLTGQPQGAGSENGDAPSDPVQLQLGAFRANVRFTHPGVLGIHIEHLRSGENAVVAVRVGTAAAQGNGDIGTDPNGRSSTDALPVSVSFKGGAPVTFAVRDLPEPAARKLLTPFAASPRALD